MRTVGLFLAVLLALAPVSALAQGKGHGKRHKGVARQAAPGMLASQAGGKPGKAHAGRGKGKPGKAPKNAERNKPGKPAPAPAVDGKPVEPPKEKVELPVATTEEKTAFRQEIRKRVAAQIRPSNDLFKNACDSVANAMSGGVVSSSARKRIVEDLVVVMNGAGKKTQELTQSSQDIQAVLTGAGAPKERIVSVSAALRALILEVQMAAGVNVAKDLNLRVGTAAGKGKAGKGKVAVVDPAAKQKKGGRGKAGKKRA
jgi:hypothetical protein